MSVATMIATETAISVLLLGPATARAEVWPEPTRALCAGPFAALDPGALAVWSNPALAAIGPAWSVGAGSLEPFEVPGLTRTDVGAAARRGAWGASAGWSRFGQGELAAGATALGIAGVTARGALSFGASARRSVRDDARAWALDAGLRAIPLKAMTLGIVARSVARDGTLTVAPDPEWELDVAWSAGAAALAASLTRDANGPVSSALASRLAAGPLRIYSRFERVARGETRVAVGVEASLALGVRGFLAREEGPVLAASRAGGIEWGSSGTRAPAQAQRTVSVSEPAATAATEDSTGQAAWDSLAVHDEMENASDIDALPAADSADPVAVESEPAPGASQPDDSAEIDWRITAGGRPDRESGLGTSAALALRSAASALWRAELDVAASRDPGESGWLDERRASLALARRDRVRLLLGSFDVGDGARSAASPARAPTSALQGAAVAAGPVLLFFGRAERDARATAAGAWPILGRYHRTALERSRRGALAETEAGLVLAGSWRGMPWHASLTHAAYPGTGPRRFPDGVGRSSGGWLALAWSRAARVTRWDQRLALGPGGQWGSDTRLRWLSARGVKGVSGGASAGVGAGVGAGLGASLAWRHCSDGFAAPEAVPRSEPLDALALRLDARARPPRPAAWLELRSQRRWLSPDATDPPGRAWDRTLTAGARFGSPARAVSLEAFRRETWKEIANASASANPTARASPSANPAASAPDSRFGLVSRAASWTLVARASWRPPDARCRVWLGWRSRGFGHAAFESWQLALTSEMPGADASLVANVYPGRMTGAADGLETSPDPLSGLRWETRSSPARLSARLGVPFTCGPVSRAEFETRYATPSGHPRLELWLSVRGGRGASRGSP